MKRYCGVVLLQNITGKSYLRCQAEFNKIRKSPKNAKVIRATVRELIQVLRGLGFSCVKVVAKYFSEIPESGQYIVIFPYHAVLFKNKLIFDPKIKGALIEDTPYSNETITHCFKLEKAGKPP